MSSVVNLRFKVTRVDNSGNRRDPYSRLFVYRESIDFETPFNYSTFHFSMLKNKIKKEFPERKCTF